MIRRLRQLLLGCPVCGRHRDHLSFCRYRRRADAAGARRMTLTGGVPSSGEPNGCASLLRYLCGGLVHTDRYQDPLATPPLEFLAGSVYARVAAGPRVRNDGGALRAFPDERQQFRCGARPKKLVIGPGQQVGRPVESRRSHTRQVYGRRFPMTGSRMPRSRSRQG